MKQNAHKKITHIPFDVFFDPFYSPENQRILSKSIEQLEKGYGKKHEMIKDDDDYGDK